MHPTAVILSPEYYWVKKVTLPVSSLRQAKRLAPSVCEEFLPEGANYHYLVTKAMQRNTFIIIAYAPKIIQNAMKLQIGDLSNITGIHFAQIELAALQECAQVDEAHAIVKLDEIILYAPSRCTSGESLYRLIADATLSGQRLALADTAAQKIPARAAYGVIAALSLLVFGYDVEAAYRYYQANRLSEQIDRVLTVHQLPKTAIQRESIVQRLAKIEKRQKRVRGLLTLVDTLPLTEEERLYSLTVGPDRIDMTLHLPHAQARKKLRRYLRQRAEIVQEKYKNLKYSVTLIHG